MKDLLLEKMRISNPLKLGDLIDLISEMPEIIQYDKVPEYIEAATVSFIKFMKNRTGATEFQLNEAMALLAESIKIACADSPDSAPPNSNE